MCGITRPRSYAGRDLGAGEFRDGPVVLGGNSRWDIDLTILPHRTSLADTQFIPYYNHHFTNAAAKAH